MTRFTELLGKAGKREMEPLGFGRAVKRPARVPDILLIGHVGPGDLSGLETAAVPFDAYLLEGSPLDPKALKAASDAMDGAVWGVRAATVTEEDAKSLKEAGVDYVVFEAAGTHAALLTDEELGRFLTIAPDLDDADAGVVHALPVDGVALTVDADAFPLTVDTVMGLHRALTAGAHAIVFSNVIADGLSAGDLEAMRGAGVSALALRTSDSASFVELRAAIKALPESRTTNDDGRLALIPHVSAAEEVDDYEYEDDEDF